MLRRVVQIKKVVTDCKHVIRTQDMMERVPYICTSWSNLSSFTNLSSLFPHAFLMPTLLIIAEVLEFFCRNYRFFPN